MKSTGIWSLPAKIVLFVLLNTFTVFIALVGVAYLQQDFGKAYLAGKTALLLTVFAVVPSGWILSYYAMGGAAGKLVFFVLASYTAYAAFRGYTAARERRIDLHRHWMRELMALLASAVLLRILLVTF